MNAIAQQASKIQRTASFWPGTGFSFTTERLHSDHRADNIPIHVNIADPRLRRNGVDGFIDARMNTKSQTVAAGVDFAYQLRQLIARIPNHVQYRTENFAFQFRK